MVECRDCGDGSSFGYTCKHCGGTFCVSHRLPEKHVCIGARAEEVGGWFAENVEVDDKSRKASSGAKPMELDDSHRVGPAPDVSGSVARSPDVNLDGSIKRDGEEPDGNSAKADSTGVFGRIRALVPF